jgi:hypothetical protein
VLDHDGAPVFCGALERDDVSQRLLGDDDAGGVGPGVPGEALYLEGCIQNLSCGLVPLHELDDLARHARVFLARDVPLVLRAEHVAQRRPNRLVGDQLG